MNAARIEELARSVLDLATRRRLDLAALRFATADLQVAIAEAVREERLGEKGKPKHRAVP